MKRVLNKSWFNFNRKEEIRQVIIIGVIAFLVPLFLGKLISLVFGSESMIANNSLLIIGTIINSLLIVSALNIKGLKKNIWVIIIPSIAVICSGLLFKSLNATALWMIPAIWLGNFALIYSYKWLMVEKKMYYFLTGLVGITVKVLIIFGIFSILNAFKVFPSDLVASLKYSMGVMQGLTGIFGVLLSYLVYTSYR